MKKILMTLILSLLAGVSSTNAIADNTENPAADNQAATRSKQQREAKRFASEIPQTLVVRRAPNGEITIFHSTNRLSQRDRLAPNTKFTSRFDRTPKNSLTTWWGWNFFWNFSNPYAYPTYNYYNPSFGFRYNYYYTPYYSFWDNYGYNYTYYNWMWW